MGGDLNDFQDIMHLFNEMKGVGHIQGEGGGGGGGTPWDPKLYVT